jgi:hypothetical protein
MQQTFARYVLLNLPYLLDLLLLLEAMRDRAELRCDSYRILQFYSGSYRA